MRQDYANITSKDYKTRSYDSIKPAHYQEKRSKYMKS